MKKRMIALMLAGIMVFSATACGGGGASSKNQQNQDDGESKQVGVEVTEDMQSAPPEDAPVVIMFLIGTRLLLKITK